MSCQNNKSDKKKNINTTEMQKYEWTPSACAPKYNPAQIHKGRFIFSNGESINIPSGHTLHQGWGKSGPTHIVGDDFKLIPSKLEITWVSYLEKKFYKGIFNLPKEKITKLFQNGYIDRLGKKETYSEINVGIAPGGIICVWLIGNGWTIEVARYKGDATNVSIEEFAPSAIISMEDYLNSVLAEDFNEETKAKMDLDNISFGKWDNYRKRYQWKPNIKYKKTGELKEIRITYYNGESIYTIGSNEILNQFQDYPIPDHIRMEWTDKNGNEFGSKIYFDEEEIIMAFKKVFEDLDHNQAELVLEIDKYNSDLTVILQNELKAIHLKKARIKIYETSN